MKIPRISSRSLLPSAFVFLFLFQLTVCASAQGNFKENDALRFFDTIEEGRESDALTMLHKNTNLVHAVIMGSKYPLLEAAAAGDLMLVKRMLELGAEIDFRGDIMLSAGSQSTALHFAVERGHLEMCRLLLEAGANPNVMAFGYQKPLDLAFDGDNDEIASLLLDYGANPFLKKLFSNDQTTPFEAAIRKSDGRLVARMLGQDRQHSLGSKSLKKPRQSRLPPRDTKTREEILTERGSELVTVAAGRGELEAVTALFHARVSIKEAESNCPTVMQTFALAARDMARSRAGVSNQWRTVQAQLKAGYIPSADANYVSALRSQERSLSNSLAMMDSDRSEKILDLLIKHGAGYDAFSATALGDTRQANKLLSKNREIAELRDCNDETLLHWAVRTEQPSMLSLWISAGVQLNATNDAGQTALYMAASHGNVESVKSLLLAKASTEIQDTNGWTALDAAIQNKQSDCIHLLLETSPVTQIGRGLSTPLHEACAAGNVTALTAILETATNLEVRNELGLTPLQLAVSNGHLAAGALLVAKGANVQVRDSEGNNLLHQILLQDLLVVRDRPPPSWLESVGHDSRKKIYAQYLTVGQYEQGPNSILQGASFLLAIGVDANAKNKAGDTPAQLVTDQKTGRGVFFFNDDREKLLQLLTGQGGSLDAQDADGNTALHRLCAGFYEMNKVETMASLIAQGANINATNNSGQTPLHLASTNIGLWDNNDPPVNSPFQLLVYKRANVNARDNRGRTPLHSLVLSDTSFKDQAVRCLVSAGADPNARDNDGMTPLHLIASSALPFSENSVDILLTVGADPNIQDKKGRTPAHLFLTGVWPWNSAGPCLKLLAGHKADFSIKDDQGRTPLHCLAGLGSQNPMFFIHGVDQTFVDAKVDFQAKDNDGNTPAIIAAKTGTRDVFDWLVKQHIDLDLANNQGETARLLMAHNRTGPFSGAGSANPQADIFEAAQEGDIDAATQLLRADPSLVNQTNRFQQTPLRLAVINRRTNMVSFLARHGALWDSGAAVLAGQTNELKQILDKDPNTATNTILGHGLLHIAAANNDMPSIRLLTTANANVNAPDIWGVSPLGYALINGRHEAAHFLQERGAKENLFDAVYLDDFKTASDLFRRGKAMAQSVTGEGFSAAEVAIALGRTTILRQFLKHGLATAGGQLCLAAYYDQPGILSLLFHGNDELSQTDRYGFAPLHWAAVNGATNAAKWLLKHKVDVNQVLSDSAAPPAPVMFPERRAIAGDTPLHLAALSGQTNMVALLLQFGANANAVNTSQMTPLDVASSRKVPLFNILIMQRGMTDFLTPMGGTRRAPPPMQAIIALRGAADELIKAAGGKPSLYHSQFGRPLP